MRTPDRHTTETFKRGGVQIAEQLARNARPLKPKHALNKTRQKGDRKRTKPAVGAPVEVKQVPTTVQRIINAGHRYPLKPPDPMALGHMVMKRIVSRV